MYQMTDAAFAEARRYCIRHHTVLEDDCWFNGLYTRVVPIHAIERCGLVDREGVPGQAPPPIGSCYRIPRSLDLR
jgi:hypothetical protein